MKILIKNGTVVDPAGKCEGVFDVLLDGGKVADVANGIKSAADTIIDAKGKMVLPGLIDMHSHLREPGREDQETIASGLKAAIAGGFTGVAPMPNTAPCCDNEGVVEFVLKQARAADLAKVYPIGAITRGREGKELAEIVELKKAGCAAISDDGSSVGNSAIMRRALEYSNMCGMPVIAHCEDMGLSEGGMMNEGYMSTVLGLNGIPSVSESSIVARDVGLAELTGARLHIAHVSCKESVDVIRDAKKRGIKVTAETCPQYFTLSDEDLRTYNTNCKVKPPLRTKADVVAIKEGLRDGTIDVIATDHAPHTENEKDVEFDYANFGMIGFETAVSLAVGELIDKGILTWQDLVMKMSVNPSRIFGINGGSLKKDAPADVTIIDPSVEWVYEKETIVSKSKNSPFIGRKLKGRASVVVVGGEIKLNI